MIYERHNCRCLLPVIGRLRRIRIPFRTYGPRKLPSTARRESFWLASRAAVHADAKQTEFCTYLSAILLLGLLLNAIFGLWWFDPAAGLVMVPIIANEGVEGLRGDVCCD